MNRKIKRINENKTFNYKYHVSINLSSKYSPKILGHATY